MKTEEQMPMAYYAVCSEVTYPSGIVQYDWNYYHVMDTALMPEEWDTMSAEQKAEYLNEDRNSLWHKGWIEPAVDIDDDEAGLQTETVVVLDEIWKELAK
jgi:hypothetical protein